MLKNLVYLSGKMGIQITFFYFSKLKHVNCGYLLEASHWNKYFELFYLFHLFINRCVYFFTTGSFTIKFPQV